MLLALPILPCFGRQAYWVARKFKKWSIRAVTFFCLFAFLDVVSPTPYIQVVALNESVAGSVKSVFKPWEQRLETSGVCAYVAMSLPLYVTMSP